ncbi:hypothetical protein D3C84_1232490 [compost metagenome]
MRVERLILYHHQVRGTAFCHRTFTMQDDFLHTMIKRSLLCKDIGEQIQRFEITAQPANIGLCNGGNAMLNRG